MEPTNSKKEESPSRRIPDIKILPKIKIPSKIVPELSIGSTALSIPHSNSMGFMQKSLLRSRSKGENIDRHSQANDQLIYDEFKSTEIINSGKIPDVKIPYWFLDVYDEQTSHNFTVEFPSFLHSSVKDQAEWKNSMEELLDLQKYHQ